MFNIKSTSISGTDTLEVSQKAINEIKQDSTKLVIFFANTIFDFNQVSKVFNESFPDIDVIGCTTAGELGQNGFVSDSITAMSIASDNFDTATYVMRNIKSKAMLAKDELIKTAEKIGISTSDYKGGFMLTLTVGAQSLEEKVMNTISTCFSSLPLVGGSSGDNLKYNGTLVSANGEVYDDAAVITFVKTNEKFMIYKENIYVPTEKEFTITKADAINRLVLEFDGKPAAEEYAKALGITVEEIPNYCFRHPLGRKIVNSIWISSPTGVGPDNSLQVYSAIAPQTKVCMLESIEAVPEAKNTVKTIKNKFSNYKGAILFNCIYRYMQFDQEGTLSVLGDIYKEGSPICGFNTYGEQINKLHVNQTLTLIAFGE